MNLERLIIYKSRNFMKLLGFLGFGKVGKIYKSRNFMKLLGTTLAALPAMLSTRVEIL